MWGIWECIKMTLNCSFQASVACLMFLGRKGLTWICVSFLWRDGWGNVLLGGGWWGRGYDGDGDHFVGVCRKGKEFWGHLDRVGVKRDLNYSGETVICGSYKEISVLSHKYVGNTVGKVCRSCITIDSWNTVFGCLYLGCSITKSVWLWWREIERCHSRLRKSCLSNPTPWEY